MIIGIDLGTTHSLVAITQAGVPTVLPDPQTGERLLPSVVHFPETGAPVVGHAALPFLTTHPTRTVYSAKRLMGKGAGDGAKEQAGLTYALTDDAQIDLGERVVSAPEVAAAILLALKARAEAHLQEPVTKAVVTVPAYFNDAQRQATKDAGTLAGLEIVRIVNEPTAASLAYGLQNKKEATIAVYDLGGGTFDISLLHLAEGVFEVLATAGNTRLGGDDFDQVLVETFGQGVPPAEARLAAEQAKRRLSEQTETTLFAKTLTRSDFEDLIAPFVERTLTLCRQTLADAGLTVAQIDEVVLVGGSTRVPAVQAAVAGLFGKPPHTHLNPDEVVAMGAAIQAEILMGGNADLLLLDVTPLSLGIETMGGAVERLLFRNAKIPTTATEEFTTSVDGQTAVLLHVVQGEREMAADCRSLARIELRGIPPLPAGIPKVAVQFLLDANGILKVSAKEMRSGVKSEVLVKPSYGLDEKEVRRRVRESFLHADEDFAARMVADMRNEAQSAIVGAEKLLREYGDTVPAETKAATEAALAELKDARENATDHAEIRAKMDTLDRVGQPLAEVAMSRIARTLVGGKTLAEAVAHLEERTSSHV